MEHDGDGDTKCNWVAWKDPQKIDQEAGGVRNPRLT